MVLEPHPPTRAQPTANSIFLAALACQVPADSPGKQIKLTVAVQFSVNPYEISIFRSLSLSTALHRRQDRHVHGGVLGIPKSLTPCGGQVSAPLPSNPQDRNTSPSDKDLVHCDLVSGEAFVPVGNGSRIIVVNSCLQRTSIDAGRMCSKRTNLKKACMGYSQRQFVCGHQHPRPISDKDNHTHTLPA